MKTLLICAALMGSLAFAQDSALAPRGALLTGSAHEPSAKGVYFITFPPPNECVYLGPIAATSRSEALYRAVSKGGFSLKSGVGGLSVWTIEEWDDFAKEVPDFEKQQDKHCAEKRASAEKP